MSDFDWRDVQAIRVSVEWEKRLAAAHSEIARLREERRWIPVGERLPEEGVDVLAIDADGVSVQWWEGNRWCSEKFCYTRPTHWLPLPAPPEEK